MDVTDRGNDIRRFCAAKSAKRINALPDAVADRITNEINSLAENPRPFGYKKLRGGGYRIRIGEYRVAYDIQEQVKIVAIVKVSRRKDAYR